MAMRTHVHRTTISPNSNTQTSAAGVHLSNAYCVRIDRLQNTAAREASMTQYLEARIMPPAERAGWNYRVVRSDQSNDGCRVRRQELT